VFRVSGAVRFGLPQKFRSKYHKNSGQSATKIPLEMPQKYRLPFVIETKSVFLRRV
jgi:hypothetical protein